MNNLLKVLLVLCFLWTFSTRSFSLVLVCKGDGYLTKFSDLKEPIQEEITLKIRYENRKITAGDLNNNPKSQIKKVYVLYRSGLSDIVDGENTEYAVDYKSQSFKNKVDLNVDRLVAEASSTIIFQEIPLRELNNSYFVDVDRDTGYFNIYDSEVVKLDSKEWARSKKVLKGKCKKIDKALF